jgi:hypothetical protein
VIALDETLRLPLAAATGAVVMAALAFEDLPNSTARLQLARPSAATWLLAGGSALAFGTATLWLLADGLWVGRSPALPAVAALVAAVALVPTAALAAALGVANPSGLPARHITEQAPWFNAVAQSLMYGAVVLVALAVPAFLTGQLQSRSIEDAGLAAIAALGFWPALLGAFAWILANNREHARFESQIPPPQPIRDATADDAAAEALNAIRAERLVWHVRFVNRLAGGLAAAAVVWAVVEIL